MKLPAHQFLDERHISYEQLVFPAETKKGATNVADALGSQPSQMAKTLIFDTDKDERG